MIKDLVIVDDCGEYKYLDPKGTHWKSIHDYMCCGVLPSCGCGDSTTTAQYVHDMLLKHVKQTGVDNYDCWEITNYEDLPVMFFLSWADREGYIDHGTTIRCSWMSPLGDELLKDLNTILSEEK